MDNKLLHIEYILDLKIENQETNSFHSFGSNIDQKEEFDKFVKGMGSVDLANEKIRNMIKNTNKFQDYKLNEYELVEGKYQKVKDITEKPERHFNIK